MSASPIIGIKESEVIEIKKAIHLILTPKVAYNPKHPEKMRIEADQVIRDNAYIILGIVGVYVGT